MKVYNMNMRPEYDFKVIGRNLKKLRLANDMTVEEVREYMQLGTVQSIYKWERGEGLPQADSLIALMHLYGVSNIEMITEEGSELSSSSFCGIWIGKNMLMSPNSRTFSTFRSRSGASILEQSV